jgi:hypothetical protein
MWKLNKNHLGLVVGIASITLFVGTAEAINLQSWDDQIPNVNNRFVVLSEFNGQAVLDKETQLVWEQSPTGPMTWRNAIAHCFNLKKGGRMGYRLPTIEELTTLVDTEAGTPALPVGNPFAFDNVLVTAPYWSATTETGAPDLAWVAVFGLGGFVAGGIKEGDQADSFNAWCVRGGHGLDAY